MALAPQTRILAGAVIFAAAMTSSMTDCSGAAVALLGVVAWTVACRPPGKLVAASAILGLVLFLPYLLLTPIIQMDAHDPTRGWAQSFSAPANVILRGMCGMLVSIATIACLSASDLHEGLVRLPLPRIVSAILVQIVHQTGTLWYETRRIADAMAVRGASGGGFAAWRILAAFPQVWLTRVMQRAERVAAAMEIRDHEGRLHPFREVPMRDADMLALALAVGWLAVAVTVRLWGKA